MTAKRAHILSNADLEALAGVPESDWFEATGTSISLYRLNRLVKAGALERVLINPSITNAISIYAITKYRRVPDVKAH